MDLIRQKLLSSYFLPLLQARRFRGKINIQRPKPVHFERAKFMELTKPYFINMNKNKRTLDICSKMEEKIKEVDNPFQKIVASELKSLLNTSKLIVFYHMNPMSSDQQYKAFILFKKENMHYKNYGKKTIELAVKDTKFETLLDFYGSHNMTVFSPHLEVKKLFKISKKFPPLILLAAIVEGKLINREELMELSLVPNLETAHLSLVQTLANVACSTRDQLNTHQNILVTCLQQRMAKLEKEE